MAASSSSVAAGRAAAGGGHRWWLWAGLGLSALALCAGCYLLPLRDWMNAAQHWLLGLGAAGVAMFALVVIVTTFLPAPDWPLPVVAGYVYGVWAFPLVFVTTAAAALLVFLAARHLARERVKTLVERSRKYRAVDKALAEQGWKVVMLMRLNPFVSFNLQNYAFALSGIPFLQYAVATVLGIIPGVVVYVYLGMFGKGVGGSQSGLDWALLGVGVAATAVLAFLVTRKTKAIFAAGERRG